GVPCQRQRAGGTSAVPAALGSRGAMGYPCGPVQGVCMRRIGLVIFASVAFAAPALAAPFQSKAPYALLVDISDGKTLYDKRGSASMSPASTTKILTAEVVFAKLAAGQLTLEDTFPIS